MWIRFVRIKGPFYAQRGAIIVRKTTKIPDDVRDYAKESNIKIIRKSARAQPRQEDLFGYIGRLLGF